MIATDTARWDAQWHDLGFPPAERRAFADAYDAFEARARAVLTVRPGAQIEQARPHAAAVVGDISGDRRRVDG